MGSEDGVVVFTGAYYVTVALQSLKDQLYGWLAHVWAVPLSHPREDVQNMAALLSICGRKQ